MQVAEKLDSTPTICRKCHIHRDIITAYESGELTLGARVLDEDGDRAALDRAEHAVLRFLRSQIRASTAGAATKNPNRIAAKSVIAR